MHFSLLQTTAWLSLASSTLAFNQGAINAFKRPQEIAKRAKRDIPNAPALPTKLETRQSSPWLTSSSQKFVVDGTKIPEIDWDIGESYAGLLPISDDPNETRQLFFWFFPSSNPDATNEVTIWFNGGPGCSSLSGLLSENGPLLWQDGTQSPTQNSYSWNNLTNMMWVEQPVGVGYTQGTPNITNEIELGQQFIGFYKQWVNAFNAHGKEVYLTGESYGGYYVPYIADAFIGAGDTDYYNLKGVGINDPILGDETMQQQVVLLPFVEYWQNLFYLNDTFMQELRDRNKQCGYDDYYNKYYTFPPTPGPIPILPDPYADPNATCDQFDNIYSAALLVNPCFNIYHITDTCPHLSSVFGIINPGDYVAPGAQNYFNRSDVQQAINAPVGTNWMQCTDRNVFNYGLVNNYTIGDTSSGPATDGTLQRVIEYTNNTIIGVGNLDFILVPNGTLFAIQNVTWNGKQGFQAYPQQNEFYVPYHPEYNDGRLSEAGYVGHWGEERGLTFYTVQLSGHELPGYAAGAGYRMLEKLLGRIPNFSDTDDFTTQTGNFTGNGTIYRRDDDFQYGTAW